MAMGEPWAVRELGDNHMDCMVVLWWSWGACEGGAVAVEVMGEHR